MTCHALDASAAAASGTVIRCSGDRTACPEISKQARLSFPSFFPGSGVVLKDWSSRLSKGNGTRPAHPVVAYVLLPLAR
jgi:hypothetical protein